MEIRPENPTGKGPSEWFTGDVYIDAIAHGMEPSRIRVNAVHFTPGARTASQANHITSHRRPCHTPCERMVGACLRHAPGVISRPRPEGDHGVGKRHDRIVGIPLAHACT